MRFSRQIRFNTNISIQIISANGIVIKVTYFENKFNGPWLSPHEANNKLHDFLVDTISESVCTYEPRDCQDIDTTWSGVYHVTPVGTYSGFDVFCDMDSDDGGWLVLTNALHCFYVLFH